jgi:hypothetical protein
VLLDGEVHGGHYRTSNLGSIPCSFMSMMRAADPDGLDDLRIEVGRAAAVLADERRRLRVPLSPSMPTSALTGLAEVEQWLRRTELDLRLRRIVLEPPDVTMMRPELHAMGVALQAAGRIAGGAGVVVMAMGEELDRYGEATAGLIAEAGRQVGPEAGPLAPMVEDGATVVARAMVAFGDGALRTAEVEAAVLAATGHALERTGRRLLHALPG